MVGDGPLDLVLVLGFATHLELQWESPAFARFFERIGSFARLIIFDKRGTGLSDPVAEVPTLEQRVDDVRAVMDAAGSERAALFGISEGGPMSVLFAATHPDRVTALVLYGAMGRTTEAPDYPWASPADALRESAAEFIAPYWGNRQRGWSSSSRRASRTIRGRWSSPPASSARPRARRWSSRSSRCSSTSTCEPSCPRSTFRRSSSIGAATGSSIDAPARSSRHRSPAPDTCELPGIDHLPWAGDADAVLGEIEEFLTGARTVPEPDRVLATVMFTDIVGSTERAAELGDARWRELLAAHHAAVRRELGRFRGREVKTLGDGFLATFDGPARAIRCGHGNRGGGAVPRPGGTHRPALRRGRARSATTSAGSRSTSRRASAPLADGGEVLVSSTVKDLVAGSGIAVRRPRREATQGNRRTNGGCSRRAPKGGLLTFPWVV